MKVSRLLGLMVVATFAILFFGPATVMAGGEHPWIENPAAPPAQDSSFVIHEAIEPVSPISPEPVIDRVIFNFVPLWWQAIVIHRVNGDERGAIIGEPRSQQRASMFGGVRGTVTGPPK